MRSTDQPSPASTPRFARLRLRGLRCFADAEVPLHPQVTVILGENGSGKPTVAEAIASLAAGQDEGLAVFPLRHGTAAGSIELFECAAEATSLPSDTPMAWWVAGGERRRLPADRLLLAYGRYRRVQFPEAKPLPFEPFSPGWTAEAIEGDLAAALADVATRRRTTTLSQPDTHLLRDLSRYVARIHTHRSDPRMEQAFAVLTEAVRSLGEGLEGLHVVDQVDSSVVMVRRHGREAQLRELSDGYQAMLVVVLDLALRFAFLPPSMEDPRRRSATVIIDEVDLHLHPRWQRLAVRQLTRLFPEVQWVLTTHSPAVVQGAIDDGYLVLRMREKDGATGVDPLSKKERKWLKGAQLGSVLVDGHLFGTPSRFSTKYELVEKRARRLRQKLAKGTATETDRARLLGALDLLEVLAAREEKRWAGAAVFKEITKVQIASLKELARLSKEMRDGGAGPGGGGGAEGVAGAGREGAR